MKPILCVFCEGNDTKIVAVEKEKDKIRILKAASYNVVQPAVEVAEGITDLKVGAEEVSFEDFQKSLPVPEGINSSNLALISTSLKNINLSQAFFIPALTEPSLHYHVYEGSKINKSSKVVQDIINDIYETKNITIDKDELSYVELVDKSLLAVFLNGEIGCVKLINSLAEYNGKKYFKIPTLKSAEISLAYYIARKRKFFPDDQSLIVYIGKEYSKLIFLQGRKLKHIGATLDIGTANLHTYDVYFSKILLEMDNGGISSLDNIIVCGEDDSENLILSFYGTFPEANVSRLEFEEFDSSVLDHETQESISAYSIPISILSEYFDDQTQKGRIFKHQAHNFFYRWAGFLF